MKSLKGILTAVLVLLGAALLAIVAIYLLVGDAALFAQLVKQLESSSEIRILHRGNGHITRTLTPTLTVDDLVIADKEGQYQVEAASLEVQISLPRLLLGQLDIPHLRIGNTIIHINKDESPSKPAPEPELKPGPQDFGLPLTPVLHDVRVAKVEIKYDGDKVLLPSSHLSEFTLGSHPDNALKLSGKVELAHHNIDINVLLKDMDEYLGGQPLAFTVGLESTVFNLSLEGHVDFDRPDPTIEATVRGGTPEADKSGEGIQGTKIPGRLTLEAQLKGTFSQLPVEEITATWQGPNQSALELKGSIANAVKLEGVKLNLTGTLDDPDWLTPLLPESLGAVRSAGLSAHISGGYPIFAVKDLDLHGKTAQDLDLSLSGDFDLSHSSSGLEPANTQLKLLFAAPTTRAARFLIFDEIPELGAIVGKCDIRSREDDPALENIVVQAEDQSGIQVNLNGRIAKFPLADRPNSGYDLNVSMTAPKGAILIERVGLELPDFGPLDLKFRIEGSTQALKLNLIRLAAGRDDDLRIGVQGQLSFGNWDQPDPFETMDLKLQAQSRATQPLSTWIGQQLPEVGPLSAEARVHTVSGLHRLDQLQIRTVEAAPLSVEVSGSAAHVTLLPDVRIRQIKLDVNADTDDTTKLNTVFGLKHKIPPIGPLKAQARIVGDDQNLVIDEVSMAAGQKDLLLLNLNGLLGKFRAANQWQPENTSLSIRANSSSSRALAETLGYRIPELGPLAAQANIHSKKKKISMDSAQLRLGDMEKPAVQATGSMSDLFAMKGVKWKGQLNLDGRRFAAFADFHELPELGALTGSVKLSDNDGTLGIDSLKVVTVQPDLLNLKVDGRFDNFKDPSTLVLDSSLSGRDLQLIGALFDRQWPAIGPVHLNSQIKQSGKGKEFKVTLTAGETEIETKFNALLNTAPMIIRGSVKARQMLVWELLEESEGENGKPSSSESVFSREPMAFDWLKKVNVDVAIEVESFAKEQFLANSAQFQVVVDSGVLSIGPGHFVYPEGKLEIELQVDARDHPRLTFRAFGEHLDPRRALDVQGYQGELEAEMNVEVSLNTSGVSPHEMAAHSQGSIYITMQNGKLPAPLIDLVFWDVAGWAWKKATNQRYYDFGCGVADYSIEEGVISTNALILDAEHITITGGGTIDLGSEKVKYVLLPKKKSLLIKKADPVNIDGPLNNPRVKTIPWKSAALTAGKVGGIIFAPFIFIPLSAADYLAGKVKIKDGESACLEYQKTYNTKNRQR
jgi:hypothetical protein